MSSRDIRRRIDVDLPIGNPPLMLFRSRASRWKSTSVSVFVSFNHSSARLKSFLCCFRSFVYYSLNSPDIQNESKTHTHAQIYWKQQQQREREKQLVLIDQWLRPNTSTDWLSNIQRVDNIEHRERERDVKHAKWRSIAQERFESKREQVEEKIENIKHTIWMLNVQEEEEEEEKQSSEGSIGDIGGREKEMLDYRDSSSWQRLDSLQASSHSLEPMLFLRCYWHRFVHPMFHCLTDTLLLRDCSDRRRASEWSNVCPLFEDRPRTVLDDSHWYWQWPMFCSLWVVWRERWQWETRFHLYKDCRTRRSTLSTRRIHCRRSCEDEESDGRDSSMNSRDSSEPLFVWRAPGTSVDHRDESDRREASATVRDSCSRRLTCNVDRRRGFHSFHNDNDRWIQ